MAEYTESICRSCFHSYVCDQFNEHRDSHNQKCHFYNGHYVPAADVVPVVRCKDCKWIDEDGDCAHEEMLDQSGYPKSVKKDFFCGHGEKRAFDGDYVKYGKRRVADDG